MSKRNKGANASTVSRKEKLLQIRDADGKLDAIMQKDLPALTKEERAEVMESLRNVRDCFKPYLEELQELVEEEQRRKKEIEDTCKREGHVGKWVEETFYADAWIDHQLISNMPYKKWGRVCTRCGQTEWSKSMPKEVINEERRKQIKELKQQIKDIESKIDE